MKTLLDIIKPAVRPAVIGARKWRLRSQLLDQLADGASPYGFTRKDVELHVAERFVRLPRLATEATPDPDLVMATVDGKSILWPARIADKDLPWLHHEVFDAFESNPSSYDHPALAYRDKQWIIDAGAAEGYFSIFALERSAATVIAIEPLSVMTRALEQTLAHHAKGKRATVVAAALSDHAGWSEITPDPDHICDSKVAASDGDAPPPGSGGNTERVRMTTIDGLAAEFSLAAGGLIKMDVEGFEMAALRGATGTLKAHRPALAVAVYHGLENARQCADIVAAANPTYRIEFRGYYAYFDPPRPYMMFAT